MKLIHCADLHLDSGMTTHLDEHKARERKTELLNTYERMISYAVSEGVEAILIAGDLFDHSRISQTCRSVVWSSIRNHPELLFFYLRGNHDQTNFFSDCGQIPDNLKLFGEQWTTYRLGELTISGMEVRRGHQPVGSEGLRLDADTYNIVMLHGQITDSYAAAKTEEIPLRQFSGCRIDYLALGHIHSYKEERLDGRGVYCYPGCLEGRGFDEPGSHGFVLLDYSEEDHSCRRSRISIETRSVREIEVDISGLVNSWEIAQQMEEVLRREGCREQDLIHVRLTGEVDVECAWDAAYLQSVLDRLCYAGKLTNAARLALNAEAYRLDQSLKGEFVRTILADETLTDEEKNAAIRYGLQAIAGEEFT